MQIRALVSVHKTATCARPATPSSHTSTQYSPMHVHTQLFQLVSSFQFFLTKDKKLVTPLCY